MRYSARLALASGLVVGLVTSGAGAVEQPGGLVVPLTPGSGCSSNVGICINTHEEELGGDGDIDVVATATIDQETFNPLCNLTFRVIARGASYQNTFGWYEVKRDADGDQIEPALEDLHVFLGCDDGIGTERTLSVPLGIEEVGFFLANNGGGCVPTEEDPLGATLAAQPTNLFFSQRAYNPEADGLLHLLTWQSRATPSAFYFGWEDQNGGGDNDFEDLLTIVTGLQCTGGGEPCATEGEGICAQGVTQCRDGELVCVATQLPRDEQCNAIDDDCNGEIDDGDLCDAGRICYRGECVPPCGGGEFECPAGLACDPSGVCRDPDCVGVDCPEGEVCLAGECVGACDDVQCPHGQNCRAGVCVDVCEGVECDEGYACEVREQGDEFVGVCSSCDCRGCDTGFSCSEHLCVEDACATVSCEDGERCVGGDCVSNCEGAKCPDGQICTAGSCVYDPNAGNGGSGGDGGATGSTPGIVLPGDNTGGAGGANKSSGGDSNGLGADKGDSGCGCRAAGFPHAGSFGLLAALAALGVVVRRKSSRRSRR